ncbi:MAG: hypothetical protein IJT08_02050 [Alphaproteobacteria bacterium]|nr:hypothetical protein [Alphaproteobacteria bacterium]
MSCAECGAPDVADYELLCFFSKRGEEKFLICRAAVKLEGRSPESKR